MFPVIDQSPVFNKYRLTGLLLFRSKILTFLVKRLLILGFFIQPISHFSGTVSLLLHIGKLSLELADFIIDFSLLGVIKQRYALELFTQSVPLFPFLALHLMDFHSHTRINLGTRHFLEQSSLLALITFQELGKTALSEHNRAEKLIQAQPDKFLNILVNLGFLGQIDRRHHAVVGLDCAFGTNDIAGQTFACAMHVPSGDVWIAVVVIKGERDIGRDSTASQQLLHIIGLERFVIAVIIIFSPFSMAQARRVTIER